MSDSSKPTLTFMKTTNSAFRALCCSLTLLTSMLAAQTPAVSPHQPRSDALTTIATNGAAYYLNRTNHNGTQLLSTISDAGTLAALNAVASAQITDGTIVNADISTSAAIALSKVAQSGATNGQSIVWNGTIWAPGTVGGSLTIDTTAITGGSVGHLMYEKADNTLGEVSGVTSNGTYLILTSKLVSTVAGVASTPAVLLNGAPYTAGNATTAKALFLIESTGATSTGWDPAGTMLGVNQTSSFAGSSLDLQVNGGSIFRVKSSAIAAGSIDLFLTSNYQIGFYNGVFYCRTNNLRLGSSLGYWTGLSIITGGDLNWNEDTYLVRKAAAAVQLGQSASSPVAQLLTSAAKTGTDGAGGALTIAAGSGLGTAGGGTLNLATYGAGSSGAAGTLNTWLSVTTSGLTNLAGTITASGAWPTSTGSAAKIAPAGAPSVTLQDAGGTGVLIQSVTGFVGEQLALAHNNVNYFRFKYEAGSGGLFFGPPGGGFAMYGADFYPDSDGSLRLGRPGVSGWNGLALSAAGVLDWNNDTFMSRESAAVVQYGADVNGDAVDQTVKAADGITGTNKNGGDLTLSSGNSTGTGTSAVVVKTPAAGASGTTARTAVERLRIDSTGVWIENTTAPAANPVAGSFILYVDPADNKLKARGSSGTITNLANP